MYIYTEYIYSKSIKMTKNEVYPTVILRVSYGYPSVKAVKHMLMSCSRRARRYKNEGTDKI